MRSNRLAVAALFALTLARPAAAGNSDLEGFLQACRGNQDLHVRFDLIEGGAGAALDRLCGCLAAEFATLSQTDVDMLARDLAGTNSQGERTAYARYGDLSAAAGQSMETCLVSQGFAQPIGMATE